MLPGVALGFELEEHVEVGRRGYLEACDLLVKGRGKGALASAAALRRLDELACHQPTNLAIHYGQFVALSGDHVGMDQLGTVHGDIDAENLLVYLKLAIQNADHFFPANVRKYEEMHDRALDLAASAASLAKAEEAWLQVRKQFWLAFYVSAFADHFLQDTYAAGHGSFNRPASTPAASRGYHNTLNEEGVILRDGAGRIWASYGDGKLNLHRPPEKPSKKSKRSKKREQFEICTPKPKADADQRPGRLCAPGEWLEPPDERPSHERGRRLLIAASRESIRDVLLAFVTGRRSPTREVGVARRIPTDCLGSKTEGCTIDATIDAQKLSADLEKELLLLGQMDAPTLLDNERNANRAQYEVERCEAKAMAKEAKAKSKPAPAGAEREGEAIAESCVGKRKKWHKALDTLRTSYEGEALRVTNEGFWSPTLAAQDPAHLKQYVGGEWLYFARAAPWRHLTGPAASLHFYTPLFTWGFRAGYYWRVGESGPSDYGLAVGMTVGVPLGTRYGSVISWEATLRPTLYAPIDGPEQVSYWSIPVGARVGIQLGSLTVGLGLAYSPAYAGETGTATDQSGWAHGWEGALSLTWGSGVTGGGLKSAPPL